MSYTRTHGSLQCHIDHSQLMPRSVGKNRRKRQALAEKVVSEMATSLVPYELVLICLEYVGPPWCMVRGAETKEEHDLTQLQRMLTCKNTWTWRPYTAQHPCATRILTLDAR
jgi:hypothetical protein